MVSRPTLNISSLFAISFYTKYGIFWTFLTLINNENDLIPITPVFKITRLYPKMALLKCHFYVIFTAKKSKRKQERFKTIFYYGQPLPPKIM